MKTTQKTRLTPTPSTSESELMKRQRKQCKTPVQAEFSDFEFSQSFENFQTASNIRIVWSSDGWKDMAIQNGYTYPAPVSALPGKNFVDQLTGLLERYVVDCECTLRKLDFPNRENITETIQKLGAITRAAIDTAENAVKEAISTSSDPHQYVHIHEVANNLLRTIIVIYDRLTGYPEQLSSVTRPKEETLILHPELCGLLECDHILSPASTHQGPRIPYAPHRTGKEITYEEIANLYRTSRVNIRRLEVDKCRPKLKSKLKGFL